MFLQSCLRRFSQDTEAAVTVDWVVLTAAVVTRSLAAVATIDSALDTGTTTLSTEMNSVVADVLVIP